MKLFNPSSVIPLSLNLRCRLLRRTEQVVEGLLRQMTKVSASRSHRILTTFLQHVASILEIALTLLVGSSCVVNSLFYIKLRMAIGLHRRASVWHRIADALA